jgi:hypothetical protein
LSRTDILGIAPQFYGPKLFDTGAMSVPIAGIRSRIRRLDGEAVGGRRLARTPPSVTRWLAASTHQLALFNRG